MKSPTLQDRLQELPRSLASPSPDRRPLLADAPNPWLRALPYAVAAILVVTLLPIDIVVLTGSYGLDGYPAAVLSLAQTVPLLLAVRRPLPAWWIIAAATAATAAVTVGSPAGAGPWPWPAATLVGYLFLLAALALRESGQALLAVWLVTAFGTVGAAAAFEQRAGGAPAVAVVLGGATLLLGWSLRGRGEARRRLAEQEQISEAERGLRTLLEERTRIARELHDVVAHHMSVITVQADSAPYRLTGLPPEAAAEFATIAAAARSSLGEMRRLLGVLRSEQHGDPDRTPQPGVRDLGGLVETVAQAGVSAELTVGAEVEALLPLPDAVDLSVYRIVQEALANVVRHAPGAAAWISLAAEDGALRITVVNAAADGVVGGGGGGAAVEAAEGTGHGLVGMRERVRLLDGRLDTGALPEGGFRVAAVLPVTAPGESTP
ncbi:sensor histidine kinase [Kitasatospora sp. MBT63]|uniref:sensor histidine kinase n=1 Tax=Kitasatospora sp. MBT63 TaxID=1444768 RepID=UPI00053A23CB|nr:histidine kinase [Kitasatospora sp. MBT63]